VAKRYLFVERSVVVMKYLFALVSPPYARCVALVRDIYPGYRSAFLGADAMKKAILIVVSIVIISACTSPASTATPTVFLPTPTLIPTEAKMSTSLKAPTHTPGLIPTDKPTEVRLVPTIFPPTTPDIGNEYDAVHYCQLYVQDYLVEIGAVIPVKYPSEFTSVYDAGRDVWNVEAISVYEDRSGTEFQKPWSCTLSYLAVKPYGAYLLEELVIDDLTILPPTVKVTTGVEGGKVNLYKEPNYESSSLGFLSEGQEVLLANFCRGQWVLVRADGITGFLHRDYLANDPCNS
jgi:hypothetical protein